MGSRQRRILIIHGSQHLTDHLPNGDGLVAWGFIKELARRGHRIHVATERLDVKEPTPSNLTLVEFPRVHKNLALHYLSYMRKVREYYDRLVESEGIDVVHQMNPVVRGISLSLLGRQVPIVLGTYVGDWIDTSANRGKPSLKRLANSSLKVALDAVQQHFASSLILATPHALGRVPLSIDVADRIEFMHHGVDIDMYNPEALRTDPTPVNGRILFVGSVNLNKGVLVLVEAFARVVDYIDNASLVVVGDGSRVNWMKDRFSALGLSHRVTFAGRATRPDVAGWLRSCDLLCAPSLGEPDGRGEPYGQNVLEAMATGKPVVITNAGGHRHLGDTDGAISVEPGNVDDLASAMILILSEPTRALAMGHHNRDIAEHRHAWPLVTDHLERIYERAIASRR